MRQLERGIQNAILDFLHLTRACWTIEIFNQGIYRRGTKSFVRNTKYRPKGVPDILGFYKGVPFMIEVKSEKGRLSKEQKKMHEQLSTQGCQVVVCRSVRDAQKLIAQIDGALSHIEGQAVAH